MAFDEELAARVRDSLDGLDIVDRKMFGGIAFMLSGNMCVGVSGEELMVRLDPSQFDDALAVDGVREFDMTGQRMRGWVLVGSDVLAPDEGLSGWVERGAEFAATLPPK